MKVSGWMGGGGTKIDKMWICNFCPGPEQGRVISICSYMFVDKK